jgi:hypothetical protein
MLRIVSQMHFDRCIEGGYDSSAIQAQPDDGVQCQFTRVRVYSENS